MPGPIGTVISADHSPNASHFSFVISSDIVRKGQFVSLDSAEGKIIARVGDVVKTNRYFERAESVTEFERSGKSLTELFPAARWEYLVADAVALGVWKGKELVRSAYPPSPGSKVFLADPDVLEKFFGLDMTKGLNLGRLEWHDVDVKLDMTRLLHKHLAILGISGSGKSHTVAALIEELLDRPAEHGQMSVIVIDTHGEYTGFAEDEKYMDKSDVVLGKDFRIGVPGLGASMFSEFIPGMTSPQRRELNRLLALINEEQRGKVFDLKDILAKLEDDSVIKKADTRSILYTYMYDLDSTYLFGGYDNPNLQKLARPGHLTVIDISDMTNLREKQ
ncbi:MAG: ATP-binding protein, partial [Candidatus Aenigmatarchaeota archaeon]